MNAFEKVVKGFAYFLAGVIILSIFSGILFGLSFLSRMGHFSGSNEVIDFHEVYEGVKKLDIDISASKISLVEGESFMVEGEDISDSFQIKQHADTLKIEEKSFGFWNFTSGDIVITVPKNYVLDEIEIKTGAGSVSFCDIRAYDFDLDHGAGLLEIKNSNFQKTSISGGAGKIKVTDSILRDLKLSAGAGAVEIDSEILGNSEIECGVGKVELNLLGTKEDYRIEVEKGLGSIVVDRESFSSDTVIGNGLNKLKVEGGIGSIQIDFE